MTQKSETGRIGEDIACEYLKKQGCKVIERNFRQKFGELDIVCIDKDKTLVFVEVKTMAGFGSDSKNSIMPEDQMSKSKFIKTAKISAAYANSNKKLINENAGWRIDLLTILTGQKGECVDVKHYKNIIV